ncbi:MAG: aminotransferase class I/II-fold pyridoxal phosphate-dependent enzyme [Phycisphaerales bacterium]|nr:aminotransferase class I/II-fold pyridoxal phosphate-dependent enzyme [Phycisphaerales bacterium]
MPLTAAQKRPIRSQRLLDLPPYLFIEIDRKRRAKIAAGADVINLGVGDPDRPTPAFIIDAMAEAIRDPRNHPYPFDAGHPDFRKAAARFLKRRFDIDVDPAAHILTCIGSKDGIAHLPLAVLNPGDAVLGADIGYPVYRSGAIFAAAEYIEMPLKAERGWLPDLGAIDAEALDRARLMWVNHPGNPTAAVADLDFYEQAVQICRDNDIILASDNAYSEVFFEKQPPSMWQAPGADIDKLPAIEFHSLSKTFNMTGWRIAFAVGHPEVVAALGAVKGNCDSGQFNAIQQAGAVALDNSEHPQVVAMRETYRERRDVLCRGLREIGVDVTPPSASFFVWAPCPRGYDSFQFCSRCLEEANVVFVPGGGFGASAKNWFRAALTVEVERIAETIERLKAINW